MSQPITVSVTMDAVSFRRFRWFDLLQHNRIWKRPLVFTTILLVFAGVCLTQLNTRHEAGLLAGVLALVALGLPAVYFWNCAHGIKIFIRKLGLDKAAKPFYRLQLDETGLSIWMAGEQDKAAPSRQCGWHHIHLAYRTENAIYLYVHQTQAYLWNDSLDAGWEALKAHLPADRLRDLR